MEDTVGMSASSVLLFPEMVLKVSEDGFEADNEVKMMRFLEGKLIVPEIFAYEKEGGKAYLLMSRIKGEAVPQSRMQEIGKEALLLLESVEKELIPSRIDLRTRLAWAMENIKNGEADMENCEPETYGKNGFHDPMALWNWLSVHAPAEDDLSLTHGDLCLNNLILTKDGIGFFDLGKCALAD
ncbi:MAG: phosphotransferase, partial [Christensenellaceae bacterium]|nr:phosphotransferase [Christensenellaceae bacterium]